MRRRKMLYALGGTGAVLLPSGLTAAAYNSFTVNRDTSIDVVSDDTGLLGLSAGSTSLVTQKTRGEVTVNVSGNGYQGVNVDSSLVIGDTSTPSDTHAFSFTNNDSVSRDITVEQSLTDPDSGTDHVTIGIYNSDDSNDKTIIDNQSVTMTGVASGEVHYVTVTVNTEGLDASTADLSGTLTFTLS